MHIHWILVPLVTWNVVICLTTTEPSTTAGSGDVDEPSTAAAATATTYSEDGQEENPDTSIAKALEGIESKLAEEQKRQVEADKRQIEAEKKLVEAEKKIDSLVELIKSQKVLKDEASKKSDVQPRTVDDDEAGEEDGEDEEVTTTQVVEKTYTEKDADDLIKSKGKDKGTDLSNEINAMDERVTTFETTTNVFLKEMEKAADEQIKLIQDNKDLTREQIDEMKKEIEDKRKMTKKGVEKSVKQYKEMEVNIILKGHGYKGSKRDRALKALGKFGNNLKKGKTAKFAAIAGEVGSFVTLFTPGTSWQKRAEAATAILAVFVGFLPPPAGIIGSALLGIAGAIFGATAPTTNEYNKLRDDILNGVADMFDAQQKAEAMGCVYKLEFLKDILNTPDRDAFTDTEFNALIIAGGIDVGVATLGTLKWKMEYYRDKNQILTGRQALEMAHMYVLVADARDFLTNMTVTYLSLSDDKKGGFTSKFFNKTRDLAQKKYKELFWWDDLCCEKDPKYFSAMLAYSMPLKKHTGKDKAAGVLYRFLKKHRNQQYYDNDLMQMSKNDTLHVDTPLPLGKAKAKVGRVELPPENKWTVLGAYWSNDYFLGVTDTQSVASSYNLKCSDEDNSNIMDMGMIAKFNKASKLQIKFLKGEEEPEPFGATVTMSYPGDRDSFIATRGMLDKKKDKLRLDKSGMDESTLMKTIENGLKATYKKWQLFAMCSKAKIKNKEYEYIKKMNTEASIRIFPVKMATWGEKRYLIGPAGKYLGDNLVLLGKGMSRTAYKEIPPNDLNDNNGASRPEMTAKIDSSDEWKNFFYVIRGELADNEMDKYSDEDIFPASFRGGSADMKCEWKPHSLPYGTHHKEGYSNNGDRIRGCVSDCLDWKSDRTNRGAKQDNQKGTGAAAMHDDGTCYCYRNVTGIKSSKAYITCLFKTTKGCAFSFEINQGAYAGQYLIDGSVNGKNFWSKTHQYAIWFDKKKQWCLGQKKDIGKICTSDIMEAKAIPVASNTNTDASGKTTADIDCPHDNGNKWYEKKISTGEEVREARFKFDVL